MKIGRGRSILFKIFKKLMISVDVINLRIIQALRYGTLPLHYGKGTF